MAGLEKYKSMCLMLGTSNSPEIEMYLKNRNSKFEAEIGLSKCFQGNFATSTHSELYHVVPS